MTLEGMSGRRAHTPASSRRAGALLRAASRLLFLLLEAPAQPPAVVRPKPGDGRGDQRLRGAAHADGVEQLLDLREARVGDAVHSHVADVFRLVLALLVDLAEQHLAPGADQR